MRDNLRAVGLGLAVVVLMIVAIPYMVVTSIIDMYTRYTYKPRTWVDLTEDELLEISLDTSYPAYIRAKARKDLGK